MYRSHDGNGSPRAPAGDAFRLPPQNVEAEQGVLGSVLVKPEVMNDVVRILPSAAAFHRNVHEAIYGVLLGMYADGRQIDPLLVADAVNRCPEARRLCVDSSGTPNVDTFISELMNATPHALNAAYYASIVHEKHIARSLLVMSEECRADCYSNDYTADELLDRAGRRLLELAGERPGEGVIDASDVLPTVMGRIAKRREGEVTGIPSGFESLDFMLGGFQPENLIILAGRPSQGKTAYALNLCDHVAGTWGRPVLFISLESSREELIERMLVARSRVFGQKVRAGVDLNERDVAALDQAHASLRGIPLAFDDAGTQGTLRILATARGRKLGAGLAMVVVDYMQLIEAEDPRSPRHEQVALFSRRLKAMARELKVPVIALSQLNRANESREDHRPRMSDLKESSQIEADADVVMFVHRPEYYDPDDQPGMAELIVAKNRNGPVGTVKLAFTKPLMRFEEPAKVPRQPSGEYHPPADEFGPSPVF